MKKLLLPFVSVFIITFSTPVLAQKVYGGVLGGPNFADLSINFVDMTHIGHEVSSRTLFGVGGFVGINLNELLSIQLEPLFVQKGGLYTEPSLPDMQIKSNRRTLDFKGRNWRKDTALHIRRWLSKFCTGC